MIDLANELSEQKADPERRRKMIDLLNKPDSVSPILAVSVNTDWNNAKLEGKRSDRIWRAAARVHLTTQGTKTHERMIREKKNWDFDYVLAQTDPKKYLLEIVNNKHRGPKVVEAWCELAKGQGAVLHRYEEYLKTLKSSDDKVDFFTKKKAARVNLPVLKGIGPKFARNIWLDWADPDVSSNRFALDSRIQKVIPLVWTDLDNTEGRVLLSASVSNN
jgi:hypothetical protein